MFIDGYSQPAASAGTVLIELDGSGAAGTRVDGLTISGSTANGSHIRGLAVNGFNWRGIVVQGSSRVVLIGNMIGTDITGSTDEGNGHWGVYLSVRDVLLRDNVISGNDSYGVLSAIGERIYLLGNKIGTNAAGTADLGNTLAGVRISSLWVVLRDNVISGNDGHGVHLRANVTEKAVIENNRIGTNDAGTSTLGNGGSGIYFDGDPKNNLVAKNIIGGNTSHGIRLYNAYVRDNLVAENYIGTNPSGADLGNGGSGVHISETSLGGPDDNIIEANVIAYNSGDGVTITGNSSTGNTVWENSIHANDGHGIDLGDDGATANDAGDGDSGPNHLQNYPANITFASRDNVASMRFTLDVTANQVYIVDYYSCDSSGSGEGKEWLGFSPVIGSSTGNLVFSPSTFENSVGDFTAPTATATHVTATATDIETGSTSEFAPCVARVALPELVISESSIEVQEGGTATYTVALSALPPADVAVTLSPADTSVATVSDATLTFTSSNGTTAQTVTVTPVSDGNADNDATEIRHLVSIGDNEFLTAVVPVEVTDNDAPALTLASTDTTASFPSDVSVGHLFDGSFGAGDTSFNKGATATYTVVLNAEPQGDVALDLGSSDTDALSVSPSSITFTKTGEASDPNKFEWDDPQTVTLTAVSDSDAGDEVDEVTHEVSIDGRDYVLGLVGALVRDSGLPLLTYSTSSREVTIDSEGGTAT